MVGITCFGVEVTCLRGSCESGGRDASNFLDQAKMSSELSRGATLLCCVEEDGAASGAKLLAVTMPSSELLEVPDSGGVARALDKSTRGTPPDFKEDATGVLLEDEARGVAGFLSSNFLDLLLLVTLLLDSAVCCLEEEKSLV